MSRITGCRKIIDKTGERVKNFFVVDRDNIIKNQLMFKQKVNLVLGLD